MFHYIALLSMLQSIVLYTYSQQLLYCRIQVYSRYNTRVVSSAVPHYRTALYSAIILYCTVQYSITVLYCTVQDIITALYCTVLIKFSQFREPLPSCLKPVCPLSSCCHCEENSQLHSQLLTLSGECNPAWYHSHPPATRSHQAGLQTHPACYDLW